MEGNENYKEGDERAHDFGGIRSKERKGPERKGISEGIGKWSGAE